MVVGGGLFLYNGITGTCFIFKEGQVPTNYVLMAVLFGAYLIGSLPSAYIVTRLATGADIRHLGDGNMGAKNTFHSVGKIAGGTVAVADIAKGSLAVLLAQHLLLPEWGVFLAGAGAVLGHDFPVYLRFRGGQGMAAVMGVFAVLVPRQTAAATGLMLFALLITGNWDLSWVLAFVSLAGLLWLSDLSRSYVLFSLLLIPTIGLKKLIQRWEQRRVTLPLR